jgi:hypothetical protein
MSSLTTGGSPSVQTVLAAASAGTPAVGQIAVATTATLVRAANVNRTAIVVVNHGSINVFVGFTNGVTTVNGVLLVGVPGSSLTFQTRADIWAIAAPGGPQTVSFAEETR